jgi:preprotein translocase SecE subunit
MATAVETKPDTARPIPAASPALLPASLVGAAVLLVGLAVVGYAVPLVWDKALSPALKPLGGFVDAFLRVVALVAAAVGVIFVTNKIAPANPPRGLRGGIFLVISIVIAGFFIVRAVGMNFENAAGGSIITGVVAAALAFGAFKFLASQRGTDTMIAVEDTGLMHTHSFKKTQGLRLRRWTMVGILLLGGSGVWSLWTHNTLPYGDWSLRLPFTTSKLTILPDVNFTGLMLLAAATVWVAWRVANMPTFADFLIATEAEMNKVSWTPWKKLVQDTIVVLVTTALLTAFLLVIDIFWGWLLSDVVKVLPQKAATQQTEKAGQSAW